MQQDLFTEYRQKRSRRSFLIFLAACVGFYTLIYLPIYYLLESNVIWSNSPLLLLWMEVVEPLMNYIFYWGAFAFLIYNVFRDGWKKSISFAIFYAAAVFLRYFTGLFSYMWVMGAIRWSVFFENDFWGLIVSVLLDCAQMAFVLLLLRMTERKLHKKLPILMRPDAIRKAFLPMSRIFDWRNPLFRLAFYAASVPAALQILSRIYYDLDLILIRGMEISGVGEVIIILSYYLTDIATAFLGALVLSLLLNTFYRREEKLRAAAEKREESAENE